MRIVVDDPLRDRAAGVEPQQFGGPPGAEQRLARVDSAAEAEARFGVNAELTLGAPDAAPFPGSRFEQDVAGLGADLAVPATHHPADAERAGRVGDHDLVRPQFPFRAVERRQALVLVRQPGDDSYRPVAGVPVRPLAQQVVVEGVVRLADLEHHVVADVDHVADRPLAGELEPVLHPVRGRALLDALDQQGDETGIEFGVLGRELDPALDRRAVHRQRNGGRPELRAGKRRDFPRDAHDRGAAGDVGDHVDVEHGVAEHLFQGPAGLKGRQLIGRLEQDDSLVVLAQAQLHRRTEHCVAGDAAQLLRLEPRDLQVAVGIAVAGACEQQRAPEIGVAQVLIQVREQVRRSGDHLPGGVGAVVDGRQHQAVGVRHRVDAQDPGRHDQVGRPRQFGAGDAEALDRLDLQAGVREQFGEFVRGTVQLDEIAEPVEWNAHQTNRWNWRRKRRSFDQK